MLLVFADPPPPPAAPVDVELDVPALVAAPTPAPAAMFVEFREVLEEVVDVEIDCSTVELTDVPETADVSVLVPSWLAAV